MEQTIYNTPTIYKTGAGGGGGGNTPIPDPNYKRLEYIGITKANTTPNISCSLFCGFNDKIEFSCFFRSAIGTQWKYFFHNGNLSVSLKIEFSNSRIYGRWNDDGNIESATNFIEGKINCRADKDVIIFNDTNYIQNKGSETNFTLSNLFHFNETADLDVYGFNVLDENENEKYTLVPCLSLLDNKLGLYDMKNGVFYNSNFTIKGPKI